MAAPAEDKAAKTKILSMLRVLVLAGLYYNDYNHGYMDYRACSEKAAKVKYYCVVAANISPNLYFMVFLLVCSKVFFR